MKVNVISRTIQEFNGARYYLCGNYFQKKGKRLHMEVWVYHNGPIPKGYDIHHKDTDKGNNQPENLECITEHRHMKRPSSSEEILNKRREHMANIVIPKASEWHKSKEGLSWHSKQGKENWSKRETKIYECTYCGKDFETKNVYGTGQNSFCHGNCKAAYRRKLIREGIIEK